MSRPNSIRAITLAGFQVFEKPTRIPLERLTFLFGPNSAGKSAVQDALEILAVVSAGKSKSYFDIGDASMMQLMDRHWRHSGRQDQSLAPVMQISIEH